MSEPSPALARLISAEAIRDLIDHSARLLDEENFAGFAALFERARIGLADSRGAAMAEPASGRESLLWRGCGAQGAVTRHFISDVRVQVSRDNRRAVAHSCLVVMRRTPRLALQVMQSSRCFDQLECCEGLWFFSQRLIWTDAPLAERGGRDEKTKYAEDTRDRGPARTSHQAHGAAVEYRHHL